MKLAAKTGFSFGLTSGVITTLGLMVGLQAGTNSKMVVIGGILIIAIADAFSDALGIHISEESEIQHTRKEIWTASLSTFLTKFVFALTFVIPVLIFKLDTAIIVSIIYGLLVLGLLSFNIAKNENKKAAGVIAEHLIIAAVVIVITHFIGNFIRANFV